jgi:predicted lipid-binding transport protein (Tim44 family)
LLDLLFFAAIAAFFAYRLYNTIGKRDHDPDENLLKTMREAQRRKDSSSQEGNVVTLRPEEVKVIDEPIIEDEKLQQEIATIQKIEPEFDTGQFLFAATRVFEIILKAYAEGDKEALKPLLGKEVYQGFEEAIEARKKAEQTLSVTLISEPKPKFYAIELDQKTAEITIEFNTKEIRLLKDNKGRIIEGDPSDAELVKDRWTFSKKLDRKTKIWQLVKTEAL